MGSSPTWVDASVEASSPLGQVYGVLPEAYLRLQELLADLWHSPIDPAVLELCRMRVAQLVGCQQEQAVRTPEAVAAGLDEAKLSSVARWPTEPMFTERERAALAFTEMYVIDPGAVTDDQCAAVTAHFTPPAIAALTTGIALFDAISRFDVALDV